MAQELLEEAPEFVQPLHEPAEDLCALWTALQQMKPAMCEGELASTESSLPSLQRSFTVAYQRDLHEVQVQAARSAPQPSPRLVRLESLACAEAGAWLLALPCAPHLTMRNSDVTMALRLRLGMPSVARNGSKCECGRHMDAQAEHALHCTRTSSMMTARHDYIVKIWRRIIREAGGSTELEPMLRHVLEYMQVPVPEGMDAQARGDIMVTFLGQRRVLDVTVVHPNAPSYRTAAAKTVGVTVRRPEAAKATKYKHFVKASGIGLTALGMETYGRWGAGSIKLLGVLAAKVTANGRDVSAFVSRARIALSVALARGNAYPRVG